MKTGIELIAKERKEQIEKHGHTIQQDVDHNDQRQLALAASALIEGGLTNSLWCPSEWDDDTWQKMVNKSYKERLITAGALIAAEIDRLCQVEAGQYAFRPLQNNEKANP